MNGIPVETVAVEGPWFEDLGRGLEFTAPSVTITEGHAAIYQAMFGDRLRLPLDHELSRRITGREAPFAHPLLAINVAIGQTTWATQRVKANLFYRGLSLQAMVHLGDTLTTHSRVVALRRNREQPGREPTGIAVLEMTTVNQHGQRVLHCWRAPMLPCRGSAPDGWRNDDPAAFETMPATDLDALGVPFDEWRTSAMTLSAPAVREGVRYRVEARDTVTLAPELVRLTLNMAMAHLDPGRAYLGERLAYGGHVISMAFAQAVRALPDLIAPVAWERCDHLAPVREGDRLRSEVTVLAVTRRDATTAWLRLRIEACASHGQPEEETRVLDWTLIALARI